MAANAHQSRGRSQPVSTRATPIRGYCTPEFTRSGDGTWAHLAGAETGYFFPAERAWRSLREDRIGSWSLVYAAAPQFRILDNSAAAHAVVEETLGLRAANFWTAAPHTAGGISSEDAASVLALEAGGLLHAGVAGPTQATHGGLRIGVERAAAEVIEKDETVEVEQLAPAVVLKVDTGGARGQTLRAKPMLAP